MFFQLGSILELPRIALFHKAQTLEIFFRMVLAPRFCFFATLFFLLASQFCFFLRLPLCFFLRFSPVLRSLLQHCSSLFAIGFLFCFPLGFFLGLAISFFYCFPLGFFFFLRFAVRFFFCFSVGFFFCFAIRFLLGPAVHFFLSLYGVLLFWLICFGAVFPGLLSRNISLCERIGLFFCRFLSVLCSNEQQQYRCHNAEGY